MDTVNNILRIHFRTPPFIICLPNDIAHRRMTMQTNLPMGKQRVNEREREQASEKKANDWKTVNVKHNVHTYLA